MKRLTIRVAPGVVADLGGRRNTSSRRGGTYTAVVESEAHEWRLRHTEGIEVIPPEVPALAALDLTLMEDAARMSAVELQELDGVGPATLRKIRDYTGPYEAPETPEGEE